MLLDAFLEFGKPTSSGKAPAGEGTDDVHSKLIEVLSFEFTIDRKEFSQEYTQHAKDSAPFRPSLTIIKPLCQASPKLYGAASNGTTYTDATLRLCQPTGTTSEKSNQWTKTSYFIVKAANVQILRVHLVGNPSLHHFGRTTDFPIAAHSVLEMGPLEEIELVFDAVSWGYYGAGKLSASGGARWHRGNDKDIPQLPKS